MEQVYILTSKGNYYEVMLTNLQYSIRVNDRLESDENASLALANLRHAIDSFPFNVHSKKERQKGSCRSFCIGFLQIIKDQDLQLYHHIFGSPSSEYLDIPRMGSASTKAESLMWGENLVNSKQ